MSLSEPTAARGARLRLGHYSSGDGLTGLVLDRTQEIPRARLDGSTTVDDLALVRRGSASSATLLSMSGELVLDITDQGGVERVVGPRSVRLRRDGDAEALVAPAVPEVDDTLLRGLEQRVRTRCETAVRFSVVGAPKPEAKRGLHHVLQRAARAMEDVCRDGLGRKAIVGKLDSVRLVLGPERAPNLDGRSLVIQDTFTSAAFGPLVEDLVTLVESKL